MEAGRGRENRLTILEERKSYRIREEAWELTKWDGALPTLHHSIIMTRGTGLMVGRFCLGIG